MGKFARVLAHGKNVTVDPIVSVGKIVGRGTVTSARFVRTKTSNGITAVKAEEHNIEVDREAKRARKAAEDAMLDQMEEAAKVTTTKTTTAKKAPAKPRKPATAKASA